MVELVLLVARLLLAAVFLLAGVAKLSDRIGSSKALHDFGLPMGLAQPLSWLLSASEIAVAIALVPVASAWYGAAGALALLGIFMVGIGVSLARGLRPDCHCFGQLHSKPVGWQTLVRNVLLGGLAGWLVLRGPGKIGPSLWGHLAAAGDDERRIFILAACVMAFLFFRALRHSEPEEIQNDEPESGERESDVEESPAPAAPTIVVPIDGLPIGTTAPEFALPTVSGEQLSLQSLRGQGKTICLMFTSPYCDSCVALLPQVRSWMLEHAESFNIVVISRGTVKENLAKMKDVDVSRVLLQRAFELSESYGVTAIPAAVLIGADGLIQSHLVVGREEIKQLMSSQPAK
jgi:methylamine dehydrogenase accessory protein MauD